MYTAGTELLVNHVSALINVLTQLSAEELHQGKIVLVGERQMLMTKSTWEEGVLNHTSQK